MGLKFKEHEVLFKNSSTLFKVCPKSKNFSKNNFSIFKIHIPYGVFLKLPCLITNTKFLKTLHCRTYNVLLLS